MGSVRPRSHSPPAGSNPARLATEPRLAPRREAGFFRVRETVDVDRRPWGTILGMTTTCQNPDHDHSEPSGARMQCSDCGILSHYDYTIEAYRHDDSTAPHCFLVQFSDGSECIR